MPQVLLINPPNTTSVRGDRSVTVTRPEDLTDWANVPSLGPLALASALNEIPGITPVYLDGTIMPWDRLVAYLDDNAGDLLAVGVSALTASYEAGLALLRHAKELRPGIWTVIGNDHVTALAEHCMANRHGFVDFAFAGNEVVGPFRDLIADLHLDRLRSPAHYPGLITWTPDGVAITPQQPEPIPTGIDYGLIDAAYPHSGGYAANFRSLVGRRLRELLGVTLQRGVPIEFARGCIKFSRDDACSFCSIQYGGMWRNGVAGPNEAWEVLRHAYDHGYDYLSVTADELPLTFGSLLRGMRDDPPAWWRSLPESGRPVLAGYARADGMSSPRHAETLRALNVRYLMVGLDAGAPVSLRALNKPLAPVRDDDPAYRAEKMFDHNLRSLVSAREAGLLLKVGLVVGHLGMTPELLKLNVESMCELIDRGAGAIASVDIEVLSPEPGSLDFRYLTEPDVAAAAADRVGLTIGDADVRAEMAARFTGRDIIDREQAIAAYVDTVMPGLTFDDLSDARGHVRAHAKAAGIAIGE